LAISRNALRLIRETEQKPSVESCLALGKFYYQLDMFEQAERCFLEAERLSGEADCSTAASA
jgi:cytochrome c-type biogenesis protein CcmH/NrfG